MQSDLTPKWNQTFRHRVLALILEQAWWYSHDDVIKPEFFEDRAEATFVDTINNFYQKYGRPPHEDETANWLGELNIKKEVKAEAIELAALVYTGAKSWELDYARDNVLEFARIQALKLAMLEGIDRIEEGRVDGLDHDIARALDVGVVKDNSVRLIAGTSTWLSTLAYEEKIPTGIYHNDMMLEGGASRGELGVILAPPNMGKSMTLVNIGFGAAGLVVPSYVSHVSCEITKERIAKRYAARTSFGWYSRKYSPEEYQNKFLEAAGRRLVRDIDITDAPPGTMSAYDVRRHLDRLFRQDFPVDCLIIDYADEMKLPKGENSFERHGENYRLLKQIAREYNIVIWTASQTGRASLRKLTIDLDDVAESFQKVARADIVLAWCQTPDEEEAGEMRLFCAKNRDGIKHWYVRCKINDEAHSITSQEVLWGSDLVKKKDKLS